MNLKSDLNNPIEYILGYCNISNLDTEFYKFISPYSEMSDYFQLDRDKWTIQEYIPEEEMLVSVNLKESFRKHIILTLNTEFRHSQNLIEEYKIDCGDNNVRFNSYIKIKVEDKLNTLINEDLTSNYPFIVKLIQSFIDTVNGKFNIAPIELKTITFKEAELSLDKLIDEVFSFLYTTKSPKSNSTFISLQDFNFLKNSIISFLNEKEYKLEQKITIRNIDKNVLNYLFYIIKNTSILRNDLTVPDWLKFANGIISNYSSEDIETYGKKLKSTITLENHNYLPDFVRKYYLKNM